MKKQGRILLLSALLLSYALAGFLVLFRNRLELPRFVQIFILILLSLSAFLTIALGWLRLWQRFRCSRFRFAWQYGGLFAAAFLVFSLLRKLSLLGNAGAALLLVLMVAAVRYLASPQESPAENP